MPVPVIGGADLSSLKAFQAALKKADPEVQKVFRKELREAAGVVAGVARTKVPSRSGRAAGGIKFGATANDAYVVSGRGVPYGAWLDFGSRNPRSGNPRSMGPWKGSGRGPKGGRFVYPAIAETMPLFHVKAKAAVVKALDALL